MRARVLPALAAVLALSVAVAGAAAAQSLRRAAPGGAATRAEGGAGPGGGFVDGRSAPRGRTGSARAAVVAGTHLQVTEIEYRVLLSRAVVRAGAVSLEDIDGGMDPHDLRIRRGSDGAAISEPMLMPGQRLETVVRLRPGVYHLWCAVPGHWALGMHATLRVVAR